MHEVDKENRRNVTTFYPQTHTLFESAQSRTRPVHNYKR